MAIIHLMKTKQISGAAYVALQADMASREGDVSATLAHLFFQCACIHGVRTVEEWDALVVVARSAESTVADAIEFGE
jgi:hypothetical protein